MTMEKKSLIYLISGFGLFLFSMGVSYWIFSSPIQVFKRAKTIEPTPAPISKRPQIDATKPRTEVCPLNGVMYTTTESEIWNTRRPLAVMIENHADSRPLSGLSAADIVYEAVAEGGITRHMGIFYCGVTSQNTMFAPVRSARIYFTKLIPEYNALYNHVGGAGNCDDPTVDDRAKALCFIRQNKIKDLDQFGRAGDFKTCHRVANRLDRDVAYEHTMACYSDQLYKTAAKYKWTNVDEKGVSWDKGFVSWKFKDESPVVGNTLDIKFDFWTSKIDYSVAWKFDTKTKEYQRYVGGLPAIDLNIDEVTTAKNIIIQFVKETGPLDEHLHMYYEVVGTGPMLAFQDGQVISGTWTKTSLSSRTKYFDSKKTEIQFNRGPIWIELVPAGNKIEYSL